MTPLQELANAAAQAADEVNAAYSLAFELDSAANAAGAKAREARIRAEQARLQARQAHAAYRCALCQFYGALGVRLL